VTPATLRLYLVADPSIQTAGPLVETVAATLSAGVSCLQVRCKDASDREVLVLVRSLLPHARAAGVPLIVNDRLDVALAAGADGVHLGVDDLPVRDARLLAGPDFIIGYSPDSDEELEATAEFVSYFGIGPCFTTSTKLDAGTALGPAEFGRRRALTNRPVVAIGGITPSNASSVIAAGADGVAVVSAILGAHDPVMATRHLRSAVEAAAT
jgi:thiamine-phosphate pyrophosphorylase